MAGPPRVRRVSATCASMASAGWQQVKMSSRRSSGNVVVFIGTSARSPATSRPNLAASARLPGTRVARDAVAWPPFGGDGERLLIDFLGKVKVAEEADQGGHHAAPFLAE